SPHRRRAPPAAAATRRVQRRGALPSFRAHARRLRGSRVGARGAAPGRGRARPGARSAACECARRGGAGLEGPGRGARDARRAARWTLVDEFDCLGRRYVLARRNDPRVAAPTALTPREQQAVGWARLGHSNKLIAYEMGISASTVRVLLHRAAARLGVRTREELIAAALGPRPCPPGAGQLEPNHSSTSTPASSGTSERLRSLPSAGSLALCLPFSRWPANRRRKPWSVLASIEMSYQPKLEPST